MHFRTGILAVAASALVCTAGYADVDFVIAERTGARVAAIVIPEKASRVQKYAAEELRDFTEKMTGRRMAIVDDSGTLPSRSIVIGNTRHTAMLLKEPNFDMRLLGDDGYRLVVHPPHLLVVGDGMHSPLFGVYGLLEDYGGCEWFSKSFSIIPTKDAFAVPSDLDDMQIPAFSGRDMSWWDTNKDSDFAARLRLHGPRIRYDDPKYGGARLKFDRKLGSSHSFQLLLPEREFYKDHPEYFGLYNGHREPKQPCLSNPDVRRIMKERFLARIAEAYPQGGRYFNLSQNDNACYCRCPACKALDDREGTPTASIVDFLNEVADAVAAKYPDVIIHTLAYMYSVKAPKMLKLRPNVLVVLCTDQADHWKPFHKSANPDSCQFVRELRRWKERATKIQIWDYAINFLCYAQPYPSISAMRDNFLFFRENGVTHVYEEGCPNSYYANFATLRLWLTAHLFWNPDQPLDVLVDRFMRGYYGAAAPHMRKCYDEMNALAFDERRHYLHMWWEASRRDIPDAFFESAACHLRHAVESVKDDPVRLRHVKLDMAMNDKMRIMRDNIGAPVEVSRHPEYVTSTRFAELRAGAQSYLDFAREEPSLWVTAWSRDGRNEQWRRKVEHLATMDSKKVAAADKVFMGVKDAYYWVGENVSPVDDSEAIGGKALRLSPKASNISKYGFAAVAFCLNEVHFDKGGTYKVRVRAKVKAKPGTAGDAFRCGLYGDVGRLNFDDIGGTTVATSVTSEEYRWYDVIGPWKPDISERIAFGIADWDRTKTNYNPNVETVWLDGIEIERID